MTQAIELFFSMWISIFNFIFNDMNILPGVNIGMIIIAIIVILAVINVVVAMPRKDEKTDE